MSKILQGCLISRSSPSIIAASPAFTRLHPRVRSSFHERDSSLTENSAFMHNVVAVVVADCTRGGVLKRRNRKSISQLY